MDVITLTKYGILNTVANLGTALTERQVEKVWRFFNHIIICFDGDQSGIECCYSCCRKVIKYYKT